jgi:2-polyprenyl-3-methyl-5-hydroxy-6-metoxy-1,4-benzoquinol methylase
MSGYFELRQVSSADYATYQMPAWLRAQLLAYPKTARILDFGCGLGQFIRAARTLGYEHTEGADIEAAALAQGAADGVTVHDLRDGVFFDNARGNFDLVVMQHVLEHLPKAEVVGTLARIRGLLRPGGGLVIAVPNGQAFTGAYWAYEDFTHHTLFTSGSLHHVLRAGGFRSVDFLDIQCAEGKGLVARAVRRTAWHAFHAKYRLMCWLLASPTHQPSPPIFSYEIKAVAR